MTALKYPLDEGDLSQMLAIERLSFPSPWSEEDLKTALNSGGRLRCLGLSENARLIGWGCFAAGFSEAHLMTVAVHPDLRRRGYGRQLMQSLMQAASDCGAKYMELECRRSNLAAQALYKSLGFIRVGVKPGYYTDTGDDALIYVNLKLPEGDSEHDPYLIRE